MAELPGDRYGIVAIGGSAGAIRGLIELASRLPADFPAAILVVVHLRPDAASELAAILTRAGPLPAEHAVHGERIVGGRFFVALPDNHLTVSNGRVRVVRGPRENGHRPAIDPLFRTAARSHGRSVAGVVLSGTLDCGSTGLQAIRSRGGLTIVQDPAEASFPEMPSNAIRAVEVDHVLPLAGIASLLAGIAGPPEGGVAVPEEHLEDLPQQFVCPECRGPLIESAEGKLPVFRCHLGHRYTVPGLASEQSEALESTLWASVRALRESAAISRRVAPSMSPPLRARVQERVVALEQHAEILRELLLSGTDLLGGADPSAAPEPATMGEETRRRGG